ncbi:hypothetical protein MRX96_010414 [Rhipicephalus microplus]
MEPVARVRHLIQLPVAYVAAFGVFEPPQEWQESRSSLSQTTARASARRGTKGAPLGCPLWALRLSIAAGGEGGAKEMTQEKIGTPGAPCFPREAVFFGEFPHPRTTL